MSRILNAITLTALLAGCDGANPFMNTTQDTAQGATPSEPGADTNPANIYARDLNADLTMNSFEYDDRGTTDPADDLLLINNIPFDNSDAAGGGYARSATTLPNSFDVYESAGSGAASRQYFAVFRQSTHSEVAAVGTGDYIGFGFGGATAQPRTTANNLPPVAPGNFYTFTGDYAAVRVTTNAGGRDDVEYITGDATVFADLADFDLTGAVEGTILNRELFTVDGVSLGLMTDRIELGTADINNTTLVVGESTAIGAEGATQIAQGQWRGIFTGPNGEEVAGFVVLEGNTTSAETPADTVRETGTFIVARP